jgi:hypothetical protein
MFSYLSGLINFLNQASGKKIKNPPNYFVQ